jgi:hypothetical protein
MASMSDCHRETPHLSVLNQMSNLQDPRLGEPMREELRLGATGRGQIDHDPLASRNLLESGPTFRAHMRQPLEAEGIPMVQHFIPNEHQDNGAGALQELHHVTVRAS